VPVFLFRVPECYGFAVLGKPKKMATESVAIFFVRALGAG
jgi:hypothetical protein